MCCFFAIGFSVISISSQIVAYRQFFLLKKTQSEKNTQNKGEEMIENKRSDE